MKWTVGIAWGRAFRAAFMVCLYSLIWWIIGGALIAAGVGSAYYSGYSYYNGNNYGGLGSIGGIIIAIIGYVILVLGTLASYFKVNTDLILEYMPYCKYSNPVINSQPSINDLNDLTKLKNLLDSGAITQAEYDLEKSKLINKK